MTTQSAIPNRTIANIPTTHYLPGFIQASLLILVGALVAGYAGLAPHLEPLLLAPKSPAVALLVWGLYVFLVMIRGLAAATTVPSNLGPEWSSMWLPIKVVITTALLLPQAEGPSALFHAMLWAMRIGVGL